MYRARRNELEALKFGRKEDESDTAIDAHGFLVELVKGNHIHETP
ncbi:hypothetical protein PPTG_21995 [Phytophthora nicotianae INRA-310]|uniref:Uncharacterized protein n=2 Tax=Phytophthora nicotianae TaxID=4792 RepID=W2QS87_PHYN3|nr:hypothetical protein PPTG_21995 [Phytophthora nicotianae INRA-310]ETI55424.1 hypothetical protein F443_01892 [Phytophthora nicotianae P1569]ETN15786.1 hypothetical protein PPTG_21995 [Phytophthora nicotianae INRA-310]